jgi:hypothetical protein
MRLIAKWKEKQFLTLLCESVVELTDGYTGAA